MVVVYVVLCCCVVIVVGQGVGDMGQYCLQCLWVVIVIGGIKVQFVCQYEGCIGQMVLLEGQFVVIVVIVVIFGVVKDWGGCCYGQQVKWFVCYYDCCVLMFD